VTSSFSLDGVLTLNVLAYIEIKEENSELRESFKLLGLESVSTVINSPFVHLK